MIPIAVRVLMMTGHRVYATALAPLSGLKSLVYGSADAGECYLVLLYYTSPVCSITGWCGVFASLDLGMTIRNTSPAMALMLQRLAEELRLRAHAVYDNMGRRYVLHTAVDVGVAMLGSDVY